MSYKQTKPFLLSIKHLISVGEDSKEIFMEHFSTANEIVDALIRQMATCKSPVLFNSLANKMMEEAKDISYLHRSSKIVSVCVFNNQYPMEGTING